MSLAWLARSRWYCEINQTWLITSLKVSDTATVRQRQRPVSSSWTDMNRFWMWEKKTHGQVYVVYSEPWESVITGSNLSRTLGQYLQQGVDDMTCRAYMFCHSQTDVVPRRPCTQEPQWLCRRCRSQGSAAPCCGCCLIPAPGRRNTRGRTTESVRVRTALGDDPPFSVLPSPPFLHVQEHRRSYTGERFPRRAPSGHQGYWWWGWSPSGSWRRPGVLK